MLTVRPRASITIAFNLALVVSLIASAHGDAEGGATRNAIFNGDFLEGRSGWSIGGPDDLVIETRTNMVAHRADAELSLRHGGLAETMTLFSQYAISVEPGRDYTLTLTAAGEGAIAFGVRWRMNPRPTPSRMPPPGEPRRSDRESASSAKSLRSTNPLRKTTRQAPARARSMSGC